MSYLRKVGVALDEFLNVLVLDGNVGDTISLHAAQQADNKKEWACLLCKWLSLTVEKNHCEKTLANEPTKAAAAIKAGLQLLAVASVLGACYEYGLQLASNVFRFL